MVLSVENGKNVHFAMILAFSEANQNLQKYCVIIKFLFSQNNCSDLNFNQKFDYEFGMQGLSSKT